jgi:TFIIF-interacting CTD phosphatase-like protein
MLKEDKSMMENYKTRNHLFKVHKMDNDYLITERPGVQEFLDFLFSKFNVSVWTAASKDYALFVIEKVILQKPGRKLDYICFSYHCDLSKEKTGCLKQLNNQFYHYAQYNPKNTIIIDDNNNVLTKQIGGVFPIKPFDFFAKNSERDKALKDMQEKISTRM